MQVDNLTKPALWVNIGVLFVVLVVKLIWQRTKYLRVFNNRQRTVGDPTVSNMRIKGFEKYRIRMGLKKMDQENWLTIDKDDMALQAIRNGLFETEKEKKVQCLPEARNACQEALEEVCGFLCRRHPTMFEISSSGTESRIKNKVTGEEYCLEEWNSSITPLEIAARLGMDDLTIILKNEKGAHYMAATASCFQIGWSANERVGGTIAQMHDPVPQWEKEIGYAVNKFMTRLTLESPMERASYFIQVSYPEQSLSQILFQPEGIVHKDVEPRPEHIIVRKERQTFRRLSKSGGILFGVKTSLTYLPDLPLDELQNMVKEINSWPEDMARYKGRDHWGHIVLGHCKRREEGHKS
ncbi:hypothetical protein LOZ58_001247 [Ophidiomyces ophidiicola]|nr:hypothetical protein LOZ58_001247 [Ophidiomyces ophidiicola]